MVTECPQRRLKILRISNSLYPEVVGGIGIHVHEMSRKQTEMGHEVTVLTSDNGDHSLPKRETRAGYEIIRSREMASIVDNSIALKMGKKLYNELDGFDVVHAHSHLYFSTNLAALFSKLTTESLAITNHGVFSQTAPMWIQKAYLKTIGKLTLNSAETIFCYTERSADLLNRFGIKSNKTIIHNGIDCDRFQASNGSHNQNQILFVGRLKPGKCPDLLLEAFANIAQDHPDYTLRFVGSGPLRSDLETLSRKRRIKDRVQFSGEIEYDHMPTIYNESDLLVLPSKTEAAIPRVVMEAWACQTPAIMTEIQEINTKRFNTGGIMCPRSVQHLSNSIDKLLRNESLREDLGKNGRKEVEENFSWEETVKETTKELYQVSQNE